MKTKIRTPRKLLLALSGIACLTMVPAIAGAEKGKFNVQGTWIDGCQCGIPCACEMIGLERGCEGVGVLALTAGRYQKGSLDGVKLAYATKPGDWVNLYIDAPKPEQHDAAEAFGRAVFSAWGKIESVKNAKITIDGKDGAYVVAVDGGKIMSLQTEPVLGGDKKTPLVHSNVENALNPTQFQGRTLKGTYHDGKRSFTLENSNAYFNGKMRSKGEI